VKCAPVAAALVVILALTGSCTTKRQALIVMAVGATGTLGSVLAADRCALGTKDAQCDAVAVALAFGLSGVTTIVALVNLIYLAATPEDSNLEMDEPTAIATLPDAETAIARKRDDARVLTKEAGVAARERDCESVRDLGRQVLDLDAEFHSTVFVADEAIKRCLERAAKNPPVDPPLAPQPP